MQTQAIQCGQTEIGIVSHAGREFAAMGSTVQGRSITGYLQPSKRWGTLRLTRWTGGTMLECRGWTVEEYNHEWHSPRAVVFALTHGRYIVGYALEESGGLFRGELIEADSDREAERSAESEAEYWMQIDHDDDERAAYEAECDDDDSEDD